MRVMVILAVLLLSACQHVPVVPPPVSGEIRDLRSGQTLTAQELLARWQTLLDVESGGDEAIKADYAGLVQRRQSWPAGMRRYIASLYDTDVDTWSKVVDVIEQTLAYKTSGERPSRPGASSSPQSGAGA